jgi:hypothetical protein
MLSHRSFELRRSSLPGSIARVLAGGAFLFSVPAFASLTIDGGTAKKAAIVQPALQPAQAASTPAGSSSSSYRTVYVPVASVPDVAVSQAPADVLIPSADGSAAFVPKDYAQVITEVGDRPLRVASARAIREEPLRDAISSVVPESFEIFDNGTLNRASVEAVSSAGPRPWPFVLADVLSSAHIVANIDWGRRQVSLAPTAAPSAASRSLRSTAKNAAPSVKSVPTKSASVQDASYSSGRSPAALPSDLTVSSASSSRFIADVRPLSSPATAVVQQSWPMSSSLSLKENVAVWAKKAGVTLVWTGSDYPVVGNPVFHGAFAAPDGPLATIVRGYANSKQPLVFDLTTMDNVLHVHNKYAQRAIVPDTSPSELSPQLYGTGEAPDVSPFGDNV